MNPSFLTGWLIENCVLLRAAKKVMMMNEADVKEMTLLIKLHISQGEQYFIDGERSIDAEKIARALLIDGSVVYSISN